MCTVRVQCIGDGGLFLFFNFFYAVLFSSIPFIRSRGMMRRDRTVVGRISGEEGGFFSSLFSLCFSNSANFSPEDAPIHGYTFRRTRFGEGGDRGCACGIEFSENLRPGRVEEGCQGRGGRMNLTKAGDRFSGELVVRRRSCRWSS